MDRSDEILHVKVYNRYTTQTLALQFIRFLTKNGALDILRPAHIARYSRVAIYTVFVFAVAVVAVVVIVIILCSTVYSVFFFVVVVRIINSIISLHGYDLMLNINVFFCISYRTYMKC